MLVYALCWTLSLKLKWSLKLALDYIQYIYIYF
jgi:hypothetical protein